MDPYRYLRDYLLGAVHEENAELTDGAAVADDDVASLLCVVEDDLVDAYARGRLRGAMLERFESFYLSSPRRRAKARFAACFLRIVDRPKEIGPRHPIKVESRGCRGKTLNTGQWQRSRR
jgi:hypothetical protein